MKNYLMIAAALLLGYTANAQFYVAASGGYAFGSSGARTGVSLEKTGDFKAHYGSAGQGFNTQLRLGYFFNESFGIDLGFGYLASEEQNISRYLPFYNPTDGSYGHMIVDMKSQSNVYGFSPSLTYKFSQNFYGRFGALLKIGGSTTVKGDIHTEKHHTADLTMFGKGKETSVTTKLDAKFEANSGGQLPIGFLAALGYKFDLSTNVSLFVEAEYMGISVKSKSSEYTSFAGTSNTEAKDIGLIKEGKYSLDALPPGVSKVTEYKDSSKNPSELADKSPYSSVGVNFGVMYSF